MTDMTDIKINKVPTPSMRWHEIANDTHAMNTAAGVLVRVTLRATEGMAVSITHVPDLAVAHRWVVTHVEAHQDDDTGDQVDAHDLWSVDVGLVATRSIDRSECHAHRVTELRQERNIATSLVNHPQPLEDRVRFIDEELRERITRWHDATEPLPEPQGAP